MTAAPTRNDFRCFERLRVRWAEIDAQKIVFNGHYLMYVDTAVAGYWRAIALPYAATMESLGGDLYVRKATLEYHASARYDDRIDVGIRAQRIGTSSLVFRAAVFRDDALLVGGELVYVFADPRTQTSRPVPPALRELLEGYERGEAMLDVKVGAWDGLAAEAHAIRRQVFVQEQGLPAEVDDDGADADALHAVARNRLGVALACGRLLVHAPGVGRVGRMAVVASMRGSRIGAAVLDALMDAARRRGDREVVLYAQKSAAAFYLRAGFAPRGDEFREAGIAHVEMTRAL